MASKRLIGSATLIDVLRATVELVRARLTLNAEAARTTGDDRPADTLGPAQRDLAGRVAYVIPRVAARMPFRADCLIQATAARRWLEQAGVPTRLVIGVPRDKPATFEAHAWLSAGDRVVTGGDVSGYAPLIRRQATDAS